MSQKPLMASAGAHSFHDKDAFFHWLNQYQVTDRQPEHLLLSFLSGLSLLDLNIFRCSLWLPTAHPELWGLQLVWSEEMGINTHRRDHNITDTQTYKNTPGEAVHLQRKTLRWKLNIPIQEPLYPLLEEIKSAGGTDYVIIPFPTDQGQEQPWIAFSTTNRDGFSPHNICTLEDCCKLLSWKARVLMAERATHSLLSVYLGPNAAQRVMAGEFRRGTSESIDAVILFCDLRGFTAMGDKLASDELVVILDEYFEIVAGAIEDAGGEILKFIGDAVLAVFPLIDESRVICEKALQAAIGVVSRLKKTKHTLEAGIALHVGEVLYGNVGGRSRLDFTVIGAAVNEAARVESLCKHQAAILTTRAFAHYIDAGQLKSLGLKSLRGVKESHELFTPK